MSMVAPDKQGSTKHFNQSVYLSPKCQRQTSNHFIFVLNFFHGTNWYYYTLKWGFFGTITWLWI
jgi:hypothetical protein